jgi:hypothetical protein
MRGGLPPCDALAAAIGIFFERVGPKGAPPRSWVFLTPLALCDAASIEALVAAVEQGAPIALGGRYPIEAKLPSGLTGPVEELLLPPLRTSDARVVAEGVLGDGTDPEVVRRLAVLGGESPLGVVEVARALCASGDLDHEGGSFVWRGAARAGPSAIPLEDVVEERLERLDDETRRVLEAVSVSPEGAARDLVEAVAVRDGVGEKARARALARLAREAWLLAPDRWSVKIGDESGARHERPCPSSSFVRRLVVTAMPPSRHAELHRFVAEGLVERGAEERTLASLRAELGWYEMEGGLDRGAERLAEVARVAIDRGYRRAASRIASLLANTGVADAEAITRAAATMPPPAPWEDESAPSSSEFSLDALEPDGSVPLATLAAPERPRRVSEPVAAGRSSFVASAEDAVRRRDLAALEELMQRAVASGSDMAAVARFRALADLLRGDVGGARRALAKARGYRRGTRGDPRESIAEAAVALGSGNPAAAVRLGLRALALARRASDKRGESAAMRTLAACYRALGREADADAIEAAAP